MSCRIIDYGKRAYNFTKTKGKSMSRQLAYLTLPVDIRAVPASKELPSRAVLQRLESYQRHALKDHKIVKLVNNINDIPNKIKNSKFCQSIKNNNITKTVCKFLNDYFLS